MEQVYARELFVQLCSSLLLGSKWPKTSWLRTGGGQGQELPAPSSVPATGEEWAGLGSLSLRSPRRPARL